MPLPPDVAPYPPGSASVVQMHHVVRLALLGLAVMPLEAALDALGHVPEHLAVATLEVTEEADHLHHRTALAEAMPVQVGDEEVLEIRVVQALPGAVVGLDDQSLDDQHASDLVHGPGQPLVHSRSIVRRVLSDQIDQLSPLDKTLGLVILSVGQFSSSGVLMGGYTLANALDV